MAVDEKTLGMLNFHKNGPNTYATTYYKNALKLKCKTRSDADPIPHYEINKESKHNTEL